MATTDTKPGFRLPWSPDRTDGVETTEEPQAGPTEVQETETTDMLDAATAASDHVAAAEPIDEATAARIDAVAEPAAQPPVEATTSTAAPARKPNKLMADLTRAMQAAAEHARGETLERFGAEAKAHIETIHATSAEEATGLRKQADDDVAGIRDWSKTEIARIREETDERIAHRKSTLEQEIEEHAAAIERRIERVQSRVTAFEGEMAEFFERILAEDDPTRLAAMAESLPEPPPFDGEWVDTPVAKAPAPEPEPVVEAVAEATPDATTEATGWETTPVVEAVDAPAAETTPEAVAETTADPAVTIPDDGDLFSIESDQATDGNDPRIAALGLSADFAAAEAEAAVFVDDGSAGDDEIPVIADDALAARIAGLVGATDETPTDTKVTQLVVTGLVSVASIAGFKRHLSRANGVNAVGVSSGPDGEFVFAVTHDPSISLRDVVAVLPGFAARVTAESDGQLTVAATDPETEH